MNNKEKKYNYTYVITCTEGSFSGKVYYGCHTTNNLEDGYIASGRLIKDYIKKYPNGYTREILNYYSSVEELNKAEYDLIHPHLGKEYCLNLTEGGGLRAFPGELHPSYGTHLRDETKHKQSETLKRKYESGEISKPIGMKNKNHKEETKKQISINTSKALKGNPKCSWAKGLTNRYKEETLNKMSEARKKYWENKRNGQNTIRNT